MIPNIILFAIVWSVGAILEEPSRPKFHLFLMDFLNGEDITEKYQLDLQLDYTQSEIKTKLQDCTNIYDYCFDKQK